MELIHVGFGGYVAAGHIIAVASPLAAPVRRMMREAEARGQVIDATAGRRTKAVIFMDNGSLVLSAIAPGTLDGRGRDGSG